MEEDSITPALIETWTRQRLPIPDYTLGDIDLSLHCPLDNDRHTFQPTYSLAQLSLLSLELVIDVILRLDILSLTAFRMVNKGARHVVDTTTQYQMIFRHWPNILRSSISTEARYFELRTLYEALREWKCVTCGDFGGYFYIITCARVCYVCFTENIQFLPMSGTQASKITGWSRKELKQLPHLRSIPGRYADNGKLCRNRRVLWDRQAVLSVRTTTSSREEIDRRCNDPRRFMVIVPAPYFKPPFKYPSWGLYCLGCSESHERETYFRKQYTKQCFIDHIVRYGLIVFGKAEDRPRHVLSEKPAA
jgi:hypothetical protein